MGVSDSLARGIEPWDRLVGFHLDDLTPGVDHDAAHGMAGIVMAMTTCSMMPQNTRRVCLREGGAITGKHMGVSRAVNQGCLTGTPGSAHCMRGTGTHR